MNILAVRPVILQAFHKPADLLDASSGDVALGQIFVRGYSYLETGTEVDLDLTFAQDQRIFRTRGTVRWRRSVGAPQAPAGISVELLASETRTRDYLLEYARGGSPQEVKRRYRRYPAMVSIRRSAKSDFVQHMTYDVGQGGAFIVTQQTWEMGSFEELTVLPPAPLQPFVILAEVRWSRRSYPSGVGVQFHIATDKTTVHLQALLKAIKDTITRYHVERSEHAPTQQQG